MIYYSYFDEPKTSPVTGRNLTSDSLADSETDRREEVAGVGPFVILDSSIR